ncbi:hypothetical protein H4582DRAFT_672692 [Lactarius indigo]|nr:hypothetical protein H4582DRAFT_672692 [Lactarius indigo]
MHWLFKHFWHPSMSAGSTLRQVDSSQLIATYSPLALVWQVRVDGVFLADDPQKLVQQGNVARTPFVTGDCDDEGNLFALSQLNRDRTDADLRDFYQGSSCPM